MSGHRKLLKRVTEVRCFTPGENRSERISTGRRIS